MRRLLNTRRSWLGMAAASLAAGWAGVPNIARAQAAAPARTPRIVAVGGGVTETLYALGAEADLVGVDTTSLYPPQAQKLPSVGYARALSAEGVLSLRPTLVLASGEAGPPAVLRQLAAAQLGVHVLDADHRIEGLLARTQRIGELVGRAGAAQALAASIGRAWQQAMARVTALRAPAAAVPGSGAAAAGPAVLFVLSHSMNQLRIAGRDTAADAVIRYAGARNAFGDVVGFKPLTPEAAIAAAPDVILATEQGLQAAGGADGLLAAPGLAATPAGRARRVVALEALFMLGFGPRLPQAVRLLAERLHAGGRGG